MTSRNRTGLMILLSALAILGACGKKTARPGERTAGDNRSIQPAVIPRTAPPYNPVNPLIGLFTSDCESKVYEIQQRPDYLATYRSVKRFLTIEEGTMTEKTVLYFGEACDTAESMPAYEMTPDDVFGYTVAVVGQPDSTPWIVKYNSFNGFDIAESDEVSLHPEGETNGQGDMLTFSNTPSRIYRRK